MQAVQLKTHFSGAPKTGMDQVIQHFWDHPAEDTLELTGKKSVSGKLISKPPMNIRQYCKDLGFDLPDLSDLSQADKASQIVMVDDFENLHDKEKRLRVTTDLIASTLVILQSLPEALWRRLASECEITLTPLFIASRQGSVGKSAKSGTLYQSCAGVACSGAVNRIHIAQYFVKKSESVNRIDDLRNVTASLIGDPISTAFHEIGHVIHDDLLSKDAYDDMLSAYIQDVVMINLGLVQNPDVVAGVDQSQVYPNEVLFTISKGKIRQAMGKDVLSGRPLEHMQKVVRGDDDLTEQQEIQALENLDSLTEALVDISGHNYKTFLSDQVEPFFCEAVAELFERLLEPTYQQSAEKEKRLRLEKVFPRLTKVLVKAVQDEFGVDLMAHSSSR